VAAEARNSGRMVVFNAPMLRLRLTLAALAVAVVALAAASPAGAAIVQLGTAPDKMKPGCQGKAIPDDQEQATCRVITKTTAYQAQNGSKKAPVVASRKGWIVALSLRLGNPDKDEIHFFNQNYGGTPRVGVAVLRPVKGQKLHRSLVAQSPVIHVQPYFGGVSDFALQTPLRVRAGDYVGLTVPTWAPLIAVNQSTTYSWRASRQRKSQCNQDFLLKRATQLDTLGDQKLFACSYNTARLTYTATEVTTPKRRYDSKQNPIK
jgi:hypothetical protein